MMRHPPSGWCWLWLLVAMWGAEASAAVKAYADRNQISNGETVVFVLEHDGRPSSQPDLTPLREDFEVMSSSRSSSMSITEGEMTARVQLRLTLAPKRTGQLTLPSITWGNERSAPVPLTVTGEPEEAKGASRRNVFLETTVDSVPSYVQAPVNVTVRVYTTQPLWQGSLEFPANSDVLVERVGTDTTDTVVRDGRTYRVVERHYVLFPQRSGKIELPGAVLSAQSVVRDRQDPFADDPFNDLFGPGGGGLARAQPIRINGEAIHFTVAPRPAGASASYWLPAENVSLVAQWQPPSEAPRARVGEPLTLELRLQADGLMAAQLPDVTALLNLPPGLKAYPDQAKLDNQMRGTRVVGSRTQRVALIADRPGELTLPELRVQWWDTKTNQAREAVLPSQRLTILPGAPGSSAAALVPPNTRSGVGLSPSGASATGSADRSVGADSANTILEQRWVWVSVALAMLWLATLAAWGWSRRSARHSGAERSGEPRAQTSVSTAKARGAFHEACRRNDPHAARTQLLAWADRAWPAQAPAGLRALAQRLQSARIEVLLLELDRACYAGEPWDGKALSAALDVLPQPDKAAPRREVLQPLYP